MVIYRDFPSESGCRTVRITLRLTEYEAEQLKDAAWRSKMTQAEYVRSRVFRSRVPAVPGEIKELFHQLDYSIRKIGTNINQIAHVANASGCVSPQAMRQLFSMVDELNERCGKMYEEIREVYRDGCYEADPD